METSGKLIEVGYWAPAPQFHDPAAAVGHAIVEAILEMFSVSRTPRVNDFIDTSWSATERAKVLEHLQRGRRHEAYMGVSNCRLCGQDNGCLDLTDGVYVWPDGLAHYVRAHNVKPPQAFVDHVLAKRS